MIFAPASIISNVRRYIGYIFFSLSLNHFIVVHVHLKDIQTSFRLNLKFRDFTRQLTIHANDLQNSLRKFCIFLLDRYDQDSNSLYTVLNGKSYGWQAYMRLKIRCDNDQVELFDAVYFKRFPIYTVMNVVIYAGKGRELEPTSIEKFNLHDMIDPHGHISALHQKIIEYHKVYRKNSCHYKAPYINFVQSSGTGKTATVLKLGESFKTFYISCQEERQKSQPTRSIHILDLMYGFIEFTSSDEATVIIRALFLSCFKYASQKSGNFTIATPEEWSDIKESFKNNIKSAPGNSLDFSLKALNSSEFKFETPLLFIFDEARSLLHYKAGYTNLFFILEKALARCFNVFAIFVNAINEVILPLPVHPTDHMEDFIPLELFPVYIQAPYADVVANSKESRMDLNMLSLAHRQSISDDPFTNDPKKSLIFALIQGRPLWYSEFRQSSENTDLEDLQWLALKRLVCANDHNYKTNLYILDDSAILSVANYKFNVFVSPKHGLAEECLYKNLALCIGVSQDRHAIYTIAPSEPIVIEAINSQLLYSDQSHFYPSRTTDPTQYFKNLEYILSKVVKFKCDRIVSREDSGEFISRVFLSMVYDMASIIQKSPHSTIPVGTKIFLNQLLGSDAVKDLKLSEEYLEGFVACSHFIRLLSEDGPALTTDLAKLAFRRGAALITWRNFEGSDIEIPVAYCKSAEN